MPIKNRRIEVLAISDSTDILGEVGKSLDRIGDFSLTWIIQQSDSQEDLKKTEEAIREQEKIDLLILHFRDPQKDGIGVLINCFRQGLTLFPTLFFVSRENSCSRCVEGRERLKEALKMNFRESDIMFLPSDFEKTTLVEESLWKILSRSKILAV